MENEDTYWINEDCAEAMGTNNYSKLSPDIAAKLKAWVAKVERGRKGDWFDMLPGMADASGTCDATGLPAPRVCVAFEAEGKKT